MFKIEHTLNDYLKLRGNVLNHSKIRIMMGGKYGILMDYRRNPTNTGHLFWKGEHNRINVGDMVIGLIHIYGDIYVLSTVQLITNDKGLKQAVSYEGVPVYEFEKYFGVLHFKYARNAQQSILHAGPYIEKFVLASHDEMLSAHMALGVGITRIAKLYKVSKPAVSNWISRYADFPKELININGPIFDAYEVDDWYSRHLTGGRQTV